jgi:hypothetical protein
MKGRLWPDLTSIDGHGELAGEKRGGRRKERSRGGGGAEGGEGG